MFDDGRNRRNSGYSQFTERHRSPMSHQVQPQLFGSPVPTNNFGAVPKAAGMKPGSRNYYCGFDTMNITKGRKVYNENVIISGYEGGLGIHTVSRSGQVRIGGVGGLRGGVFNAKILPWTINDGSRKGSSFIAVVVHGPVLNDEDVEFGEEAGDQRQSSGSSLPRASPRGSQKGANTVTCYQTTVEVYCLRTKKYIATLLTLPRIELALPVTHSRFVPPPPIGSLAIQADSGNVVITSGLSGEIFIFRLYRDPEDNKLAFRPLGKYWTTIQAPLSPDSSDYIAQLDAQRTPTGEKAKKPHTRAGLVSLRGRWLAFVPSSNNLQVSTRATVNVSRSPRSKIPGLNTFAPPALPKADCAVETPCDEGWGTLGRTAAQEAIKGGKWIADQGAKAWSSYWNKPSPPGSATTNWTPPSSIPQADLFPPTHGSGVEGTAVKDEPVMISIVDLEVLSKIKSSNAAPATLASFRLPPGGCSHLSLSPSGLHLFTASAKGDVQTIFDLFRLRHSRSSPIAPLPTGHPSSNHVRQIARFTRLTVARITDVVWNDSGNMLAMVTERNTVHFLDLPRGAFVWPPPRNYRKKRHVRSPSSSKSAAPSAKVLGLASNAAQSAWSFASPFINRPRGLSSGHAQSASQDGGATAAVTSQTPTSRGAIAAQLAAIAGQSGKVIASGISKSVGAAASGVQQFRQKGDNKLHLPIPSSPRSPAPSVAGGNASLGICGPGCIKFLGSIKPSGTRKRKGVELFGVLLDGAVKIYRVRHIVSKNQKGVPVRRVHVSSKSTDVVLPAIPDHQLSAMVRRALELDDFEGDEIDAQLDREVEREARRHDRRASRTSTSTDPERGGSTAVLPVRTKGTEIGLPGLEGQNYIPMAEIESGAPYQPFHTDPRVTLSVYSFHPAGFGASAATTPSSESSRSERSQYRDARSKSQGQVHAHPPQGTPDGMWIFGRPVEAKVTVTHRSRDEEVGEDGGVLERVMSREGEEIVCTTRRRRVKREQGVAEEGEEGFFEDDCDVIDFARDRV